MQALETKWNTERSRDKNPRTPAGFRRERKQAALLPASERLQPVPLLLEPGSQSDMVSRANERLPELVLLSFREAGPQDLRRFIPRQERFQVSNHLKQAWKDFLNFSEEALIQNDLEMWEQAQLGLRIMARLQWDSRHPIHEALADLAEVSLDQDAGCAREILAVLKDSNTGWTNRVIQPCEIRNARAVDT